jgi:tRNA G10  N-methylase Trm11
MGSETEVIRSVYDNQSDILRAIMALHTPEGFDVDLTYGNGAFWRDIPAPTHKFDIDPQVDGVQRACSTATPLANASVSSAVFDPPFLTYVRAGREGNGKMLMAQRFAGYWRYDELADHYKATLRECARILRRKGVLVFKCQDIVHNHRLHCTHANVIQWAADASFRLLDLFILPAKHRLPSPNRAGTQKHARIFHSYFLVFQC